MKFSSLFPVGLLCLACGSSGGTDAAAGSGGTGTGGTGTGGTGTGGTGGASPSGLSVVLAASTASFPHQDSLASQTAMKVSAGVKTLQLLDDQGGVFTLFEASGDATVVSYDDGASTALSSLEQNQVRAGHYTKARIVQDWSRFEIGATLHELSASTPGTLAILQITSQGVTVGGEAHAAGDYEHVFTSGGTSKPFKGSAPIPETSKTAEAEAIVENGQWAVYFPIDLTVTAATAGTLTIVANMDHAFRWTDTPGLENQPDVYDIAPPLYELVEQFGANRFELSLTP